MVLYQRLFFYYLRQRVKTWVGVVVPFSVSGYFLFPLAPKGRWYLLDYGSYITWEVETRQTGEAFDLTIYVCAYIRELLKLDVVALAEDRCFV